MADDSKDPIYRDYYDQVRSLPAEPNAIVLETALTCLLAYLDTAPAGDVKRLRQEVLPTVIEKGLASQRAGAKAKAVECIQMMIEADLGEPVVAELCGALGGKQPKLVASVLATITDCLRSFGPEVVSIKLVGKHLVAAFANADKNIRQEATNLALEVYRWIGRAIDIFLTNEMKPIQVKDLNEAFAKEAVGQQRATRYLKSVQRQMEKRAAEMQVDNPSAGEAQGSSNGALPTETAPPIDPLELVDPVNVLDAIPEQFDALVTSALWKERKEALDGLLALVKVPKLAAGHYGTLVDTICKRIADINVLVVIAAAQCLECLATGLRHQFSPHRTTALTAVLERCKEKKPTVIEALRATLNALPVTGWVEIAEPVTPFLVHKNPQVRGETLQWISRIDGIKALTKKDAKAMIDALLPAFDDGVNEVREAAASAIAKVYTVVGEKAGGLLTEGLDKLKLQKVMEQVAARGKAQAEQRAPPAATTAAHPAVVVEPVAAVRAIPADRARDEPTAGTRKASVASSVKRENLLDMHPNPSTSLPSPIDYFTELIGEETVASLKDSNWKNRLTAIESLATQVDRLCFTDDFDPELIVCFFATMPGWRDSNFQVVGKMIHILHQLTTQKQFGNYAIVQTIAGLAEKLSDPKLGQPCADLFLCLAEQSFCGLVLHHVIESVRAQKSPKILADIINWVKQCIVEFATPQGQPVKELCEFVRAHLGNSNGTVRQAAVGLAATLKHLFGQDPALLFAGTSPQLIAAINQEGGLLTGHQRSQRAFTRSLSNTAVSVDSQLPEGGGRRLLHRLYHGRPGAARRHYGTGGPGPARPARRRQLEAAQGGPRPDRHPPRGLQPPHQAHLGRAVQRPQGPPPGQQQDPRHAGPEPDCRPGRGLGARLRTARPLHPPRHPGHPGGREAAGAPGGHQVPRPPLAPPANVGGGGGGAGGPAARVA